MEDEAFAAHYGTGIERGRLFAGEEPGLELVRTLELLERFLPAPPARVLDVGGGPGAYASILARQGYEVELIDVLPLHVDQATAVAASQPEAPFAARLGNARDLDAHDDCCDAVLLFGPLYHLTEREDRLQALREARRVVRPGGVVLGAAISRFASLLDGLKEGFLADPAFAAIVERDLREGQHRNPEPVEKPDWFTTAFFHHPDELAEEVGDAGLVCEAVLGVEGLGWLIAGAWQNPARRESVLSAARLVEAEPTVRGASAHLLVVGRKAA